MAGIKKKKLNGRKCCQRGVCLRPLVDEALRDFLKKNPDETFSNWSAKIIKQELINTGYYTK